MSGSQLARLIGLALPVALAGAFTATLAAQVFQGSLTKPTVLNDNMGYDLAIDGNWVITSQPHFTGASGTVRTYLRNAQGFTLTQTLSSPLPAGAQSHFGNSVACDGGFLAVGAPLEGPGRVHVYRELGGTWSPFQILELPGWGDGFIFGQHVQLVGQRLLAYHRGSGTGALPRIRIYAFDGQQWALEQVLLPPDAQTTVTFGWAMSLEGDRIAIADEQYLYPTGRVFQYRRIQGVWTLEHFLKPPPDGSSLFGAGLAFHGGRLLVGATNATPFGDNGRVFVHDLVGSTWIVTAQLEYNEPPPQPGSWKDLHFGAPIQAHGDWIAVGQDMNYNGTLEPSVHLFRHDGLAYVFERKLTAAKYGDPIDFGHEFAFSDGVLAVRTLEPGLASEVVSFECSQLGQPLQAWPQEISLSTGGQQKLLLDATGMQGFHFALVLGSLSGTTPGIPIGALTLPLNSDA